MEAEIDQRLEKIVISGEKKKDGQKNMASEDCPEPPGLVTGMSWNKILRRKSQRAMGPCIGFTMKAYETITEDPRYMEGMRTFEVTEKIIKPMTKQWKCSFASFLVSVKSIKGEIANCFVSHAWAYPFSVLLETMRADAECRSEPTYYWLDIVAINQHEVKSLGKDFWSTAFRRSIKQIGRTLMVLYPWKNPVPFKRAWCLWELYCTVSTNSSLNLRIAPQEIKSFAASLVEHFDDLMRAIGTIDAATAEATVASDRDQIFEAIKDDAGTSVDSLNCIIMIRFRRWLAESAMGLLREIWPDAIIAANVEKVDDGGRVDTSKKTSQRRSRFGDCRGRLSGGKVGRLRLAHQVARLLLELTEYEVGIRLLRYALTVSLGEFGRSHEVTQRIFNLLVWVLIDKAKYEEAEAITSTAMEENERILGKHSLITIQNYCHQIRILHETGRLTEAAKLGDVAIACSESADARATGEMEGKPTVRTLELYFLVGKLLCDMRRFVSAAATLRKAIEGCDATQVPRHWVRMSSEAFLGKVMLETGKIRESIVVLRHALRDARTARGERHKITLYAKAFLCRALVLAKDTDSTRDATALATRAIADCNAVLGARHWLSSYSRENIRLLRSALPCTDSDESEGGGRSQELGGGKTPLPIRGE